VAPGARGEVLGARAQRDERLLAPARSQRRGAAGGWFHSGDMGHLDAEGYLWIDGRKKDMIISGGENIAPAEIENVLLDCPDIAEVSVVGRPDARWGEIVVAVVAPKGGRRLDRRRCSAARGPHRALQAPQGVVFVGHAAEDRARQDPQGRRAPHGRAASASRTTKTRSHAMTLKIGIDVGGTFTDFVVARDGEEPAIFKIAVHPVRPLHRGRERPHRHRRGDEPADDARGLRADRHHRARHHRDDQRHAHAHRRKCGLLTTEGVRDALEMRRGIREEQYNNRYANVRRSCRARCAPASRAASTATARGRAARPRGRSRRLALFKQEGVQAVAVCFMNSFANPAHEQAAAEMVKKEMPGAYLSVSTEVLPSIRFYERVSTTALNAYVGPKLNHYLDQLVARLGIGFKGLLLIMQSNGGVISPQRRATRRR
jgi:hypothetical protein